MRTIRERLEEWRTARDLFPRCYRCGRDLSNAPLFSLRVNPERNRFACPSCPSHYEPQEAAD